MPLNCFASDTMQYAFLCEGAYVTKQNKTRKKKKKNDIPAEVLTLPRQDGSGPSAS